MRRSLASPGSGRLMTNEVRGLPILLDSPVYSIKDMEKIIVLCGGRSAEHEISIISARAVVKGLRDAGYQVQVLGIKKDGSSFSSDEIASALGLPVSCRLLILCGGLGNCGTCDSQYQHQH